MNDRPPPLDADTVERFIRACHGDEATVQAMLESTPNLANACWDWGAGDYETALGAAAHTGSAEIIRLLVRHGARLDIFAATALGLVDIVEAYLQSVPDGRRALGAHGIPLLAHARIAGQDRIAALLEENSASG